MRGKPAGTVDDYLKMVPEDMRVALEKLRRIIKAAAPETTQFSRTKVIPSSASGQPRTIVRFTS
jgi:hypothetical protein